MPVPVAPAAGHHRQDIREHLIKIGAKVVGAMTLRTGKGFADAANCHGFKRARWRGLWKRSIQDLLIATVENLRKLVNYLGRTHPQLACRCAPLLRELGRLLLNFLSAPSAA